MSDKPIWPPLFSQVDWPTVRDGKDRMYVDHPGWISNYEPTPRERLVYFLDKSLFGDDRQGRERAEFLIKPLEFTPLAVGEASYETTRAIGEGRYSDAIIPALTVAGPLLGKSLRLF